MCKSGDLSREHESQPIDVVDPRRHRSFGPTQDITPPLADIDMFSSIVRRGRLKKPINRPGYARRPASDPRVKASVGRGRRIRTADPLLPKQMRYQTAPCPAAFRPLESLPPL